jgi:hypothetical protein
MNEQVLPIYPWQESKYTSAAKAARRGRRQALLNSNPKDQLLKLMGCTTESKSIDY